MTDEIVEFTTALLDPVPLDPAVMAQMMKIIEEMIYEENRRMMEKFLMMQPPQTAKKSPCDCRGLLHSCAFIV